MNSKIFIAIILIVVGGVTLWYFLSPSAATPETALNTNIGSNLPKPGTEAASELQKEVSLRIVDELIQDKPVNVDAEFKEVEAMLDEFHF